MSKSLIPLALGKKAGRLFHGRKILFGSNSVFKMALT